MQDLKGDSHCPTVQLGSAALPSPLSESLVSLDLLVVVDPLLVEGKGLVAAG